MPRLIVVIAIQMLALSLALACDTPASVDGESRSLAIPVLPMLGQNRGLEEPTLHVVLQGHTSCVQSVAFSPDCRMVATSGMDSTIRLWEVATGKVRTVIQDTGSWTVAICPCGKLLAGGTGRHGNSVDIAYL